MTLERLKELAELGIITQTQIVEYYTDPEHSDELAEMSEEDLLNNGLVTRVACPELLLDGEQPSDEDYEDVADAESLKAIVEGGGAARLASSIDMTEEVAVIPAGQRVFLKLDEGVELKVRTIQASKGSSLQVEGGKITSSQAGSTLRVSGCSLTIKGAEIVNDYSGKSTSGAVNDTGSSNITIEDSSITSAGMHALVIGSKSAASIKNTGIVSASNSGIVVKSVNPVAIENVSVTANTDGRVDDRDVIAALQATVAAKIKISGEDTKMSTRGDNPTVYANWAGSAIEIEAGEFWVDEPGKKNYTLNQKDGIEGSCFVVSGGKFRGFNPEASAEADRRSFLKEGYVARESEGVWEVIPGVYSEYVAEASMPEKVVAGIENPMSVTLKTAKEGTASYQKVRIYFETECPEGAQVTYKISAGEDQELEFVNDGTWGPEGGFELPIEYEATTSLKAIPSMAGTYKTITRLVDLATGRNINEDIADVVVVGPSYSQYEIVSELPENITVGEPASISTTLRNVTVGEKDYEKVRLYFDTTVPSGGTMTYKMTDSQSHDFTFENEGAWGPEEGFPLPKEYSATTPITITASVPGTYTTTVKLVDLTTSTTIATAENSVVAQ